MTGWRIELRERPLDAAYGIADNALLAWGQGKGWGPDAGHSYFALIDDQGAVAATMDGNAFTPANGMLAKGGQTTAGYISAAANELGFSNFFNKAAKWMGYDLDVPRLRVSVDDGPDRLARADTVKHNIFSGTQQDVMRRWTAATEAGAAINRSDLLYQGLGLNNYGVNCHTVTSALMDVMDIIDKPAYVFAAPGSSSASIQNLHQNVPSLFEYGPNTLVGLDAEYLKSSYNQAKIDLTESLTSPELREQILARAADQPTRPSNWAFGYGNAQAYTQG